MTWATLTHLVLVPLLLFSPVGGREAASLRGSMDCPHACLASTAGVPPNGFGAPTSRFATLLAVAACSAVLLLCVWAAVTLFQLRSPYFFAGCMVLGALGALLCPSGSLEIERFALAGFELVGVRLGSRDATPTPVSVALVLAALAVLLFSFDFATRGPRHSPLSRSPVHVLKGHRQTRLQRSPLAPRHVDKGIAQARMSDPDSNNGPA